MSASVYKYIVRTSPTPQNSDIKTPAYLHKPGFAELAQLSIKDMQIDLTLRA